MDAHARSAHARWDRARRRMRSGNLYAVEDWLYRSELLAEDTQALEDGEHVNGPAVDA